MSYLPRGLECQIRIHRIREVRRLERTATTVKTVITVTLLNCQTLNIIMRSYSVFIDHYRGGDVLAVYARRDKLLARKVEHTTHI